VKLADAAGQNIWTIPKEPTQEANNVTVKTAKNLLSPDMELKTP
jgi:hypothetical protein